MFCIVISILYPYHPALMAFGALNLGTDITAFYFILKKYVKKKKTPKNRKSGNHYRYESEANIDTNREGGANE